MHHPRRVMRETMPTSYAYIKGAPGLGPVQDPCIRRTPRSWPRSPAQLCGSPQYLERPSPHTSSLGSIKASHSRAPHSRSAAAAVGTEGASLHAASRSRDCRLRGIQGRRRPDRGGSRLLDSSCPALLGCKTTHFRVVTETFCSL